MGKTLGDTADITRSSINSKKNHRQNKPTTEFSAGLSRGAAHRAGEVLYCRAQSHRVRGAEFGHLYGARILKDIRMSYVTGAWTSRRSIFNFSLKERISNLDFIGFYSLWSKDNFKIKHQKPHTKAIILSDIYQKKKKKERDRQTSIDTVYPSPKSRCKSRSVRLVFKGG